MNGASGWRQVASATSLGAQLRTVCGEPRAGIVLAGSRSVSGVLVCGAVAAHPPVALVSNARAQMHEGDGEGGSGCSWQGRLCY